MLAAAQEPQCTCEYMRTPSTAQRCTGRTSAAGAWMRKSGRSNWVAQQVTRGSCRSVQNAMRLDITGDRKSVVSGQSVAIRVDLGGRRIIKKKKQKRITKETRN